MPGFRAKNYPAQVDREDSLLPVGLSRKVFVISEDYL
jgi:hypothetical protein